MRENSTYGRKGIEKSTSSADHTKVVRRLNKKAHKRKRNYKLALIKPTQLIDGKPLKFERSLTPTRVLPYIAALTPEEFEVSIIDDTIEEINYSMETDIVGITSLLPQVPRAIQIADNFRNRGIKVVMGGVGASSLPDEVLPHVDSLVIGEAENIWHKVLEDFKQNKLEKIYRANQLYSMNNMAIPRFELLRKEGYVKPGKAISSSELPRVPVETSRGCPHDCSFCYVSRYFGRKVRYRPVEEVINEMKVFPNAYFFLVDDNINANHERAKILFKAMTPLKNRWLGQFSSSAANDEELLRLAKKSGCINAFVGIESIYSDTLKSIGKRLNLQTNVEKVFRVFKEAGIDLNVSMIFGFDNDTLETITETVDFMIARRIHLMSLFILTPIPGTKLYAQLEEEGRILHKDFSFYDGTHAVFKPKNMTAEKLEEKYWESFEKFYATSSIVHRFSDTFSWIFRNSLIPLIYTYKGNLFYKNAIRQRVHPLSGEKVRDNYSVRERQ